MNAFLILLIFDFDFWYWLIDKQSTFAEFLEKDDSVSTHIRNLQILVIEMYKVVVLLKLWRKLLDFTKKIDVIWDIEIPSEVL